MVCEASPRSSLALIHLKKKTKKKQVKSPQDAALFLEDGQITSQTLRTQYTCEPPSKSFILTEGRCILCCLEASLLKQKEDILKSITGQTIVSIQGGSRSLPREVTKCSWALKVFMQRLFLQSQILKVLSSAQLTMNFPPGWKSTPRTQLSWPTCTRQQNAMHNKHKDLVHQRCLRNKDGFECVECFGFSQI